jgi:hypothetical protein
MTYVKQLEDYEEAVMRKRLEEMPEAGGCAAACSPQSLLHNVLLVPLWEVCLWKRGGSGVEGASDICCTRAVESGRNGSQFRFWSCRSPASPPPHPPTHHTQALHRSLSLPRLPLSAA